MTVQDLIEELQALPVTSKNLEVVLPRKNNEWRFWNVRGIHETLDAATPVIVIGSRDQDEARVRY